MVTRRNFILGSAVAGAGLGLSRFLPSFFDLSLEGRAYAQESPSTASHLERVLTNARYLQANMRGGPIGGVGTLEDNPSSATIPPVIPDASIFTDTLYADQTATTSGNGSELSPFKSLQAAVNAAQPFTRIIVAGDTTDDPALTISGNYVYDLIQISSNKNNLWLDGPGAPYATIKGTGPGSAGIRINGAQNIYVSGFCITNADNGLFVDGITTPVSGLGYRLVIINNNAGYFNRRSPGFSLVNCTIDGGSRWGNSQWGANVTFNDDQVDPASIQNAIVNCIIAQCSDYGITATFPSGVIAGPDGLAIMSNNIYHPTDQSRNYESFLAPFVVPPEFLNISADPQWADTSLDDYRLTGYIESGSARLLTRRGLIRAQGGSVSPCLKTGTTNGYTSGGVDIGATVQGRFPHKWEQISRAAAKGWELFP